MTDLTDKDYQTLALALAERGCATVSPNPMVGCVIVRDNVIVGKGFHQRAGCAHAEVIALADAGTNAQGATAYVTLEPCCHTGRTPPCTDALIAAGIKKVVVACTDPNPLVAGKGITTLRNAGIMVEVGCLEAEAKNLNKTFFHYIQHKRPYVLAKWAMSLDGKTITAPEDTRAISSLDAQRATHATRHLVDAILIGAGTALHDDPQLTVREIETIHRHPLRIVLAGKRSLPLSLKLFSNTLPSQTIVAVTTVQPWHQDLRAHGIEVINFPANEQGQVDLLSLLSTLGEREITSLLVEGGMTVLEQFFKLKLVNEVQVYVAPVIIGQSTKKQQLTAMRMTTISGDYLFNAQCEEQHHV